MGYIFFRRVVLSLGGEFVVLDNIPTPLPDVTHKLFSARPDAQMVCHDFLVNIPLPRSSRSNRSADVRPPDTWGVVVAFQ